MYCSVGFLPAAAAAAAVGDNITRGNITHQIHFTYFSKNGCPKLYTRAQRSREGKRKV